MSVPSFQQILLLVNRGCWWDTNNTQLWPSGGQLQKPRYTLSKQAKGSLVLKDSWNANICIWTCDKLARHNGDDESKYFLVLRELNPRPGVLNWSNRNSTHPTARKLLHLDNKWHTWRGVWSGAFSLQSSESLDVSEGNFSLGRHCNRFHWLKINCNKVVWLLFVGKLIVFLSHTFVYGSEKWVRMSDFVQVLICRGFAETVVVLFSQECWVQDQGIDSVWLRSVQPNIVVYHAFRVARPWPLVWVPTHLSRFFFYLIDVVQYVRAQYNSELFVSGRTTKKWTRLRWVCVVFCFLSIKREWSRENRGSNRTDVKRVKVEYEYFIAHQKVGSVCNLHSSVVIQDECCAPWFSSRVFNPFCVLVCRWSWRNSMTIRSTETCRTRWSRWEISANRVMIVAASGTRKTSLWVTTEHRFKLRQAGILRRAVFISCASVAVTEFVSQHMGQDMGKFVRSFVTCLCG